MTCTVCCYLALAVCWALTISLFPLCVRSAKLAAEAPTVASQALQDITLPDGAAAALSAAKASSDKTDMVDKPKIMYNLDKEGVITPVPVKPPQPKDKERKSRSSSKSSRSSHSSRSSSGSRSPPPRKSRSSSESDSEKKKEKKVVEVGITFAFLVKAESFTDCRPVSLRSAMNG